MSKGFNMIGWRMAFVCGHPKIVQAFADVKDNSDSGQFMAIQQAARAALEHPELADRIREKYRRRLRKLVAALNKVGFQAKMPGGTYFLYVRVAEGLRRQGIRQRRRGLAVPDSGAVGHLRALGQRRGVFALLGDVSGQGRGGGRSADDGDGGKVGTITVAVLITFLFFARGGYHGSQSTRSAADRTFETGKEGSSTAGEEGGCGAGDCRRREIEGEYVRTGGWGLKVRALPKMLEEDGWVLDRTRGSHRQLFHPSKPGTVTVSGHQNDDIHPKTLKSVLRQADLEDEK